jgi:hypothetical protein
MLPTVQKKNKNLLDPESIQIFKNILLSKEQPLQFLLNKYNITFNEIFN